MRLFVILILIANLCSSCSKDSGQRIVTPPFTPNDGVVAREISLFVSKPAGMTGDQHIFGEWNLEGTSDDIGAATSNSRVVRKLYWIKGDSIEFRQAIEFFRAYPEFRTIALENLETFNDTNVCYAYVDLLKSTSDNTIRYASMWICSPKAKKLLYLSGH